MAKQLSELDELFSNEVSDQDYLLIRDKSSLQDKKITAEALKTAFLSAIGELGYKDTVSGDDIDSGSIDIDKVNFINTDPNAQYVLAIGDVQIIAGANNAALSGTTVTFKKPFASAPAVTCTTRDTNNQTGWFSAVTSTNVTLKQAYSSNNLLVNWIAIGARGDW